MATTEAPQAHTARRGSSNSSSSSNRTRSLVRGIVASAGGKLATIAAPLLVIPATFSYLGADTYGVWMAATSITSMALFADLGMGNSLLTVLAERRACGDERGSRRAIASSYVFLIAIAAAITISAFLSVFAVEWSDVFSVTDGEAASQTSFIVVACFSAFAVNVPASLIQRVQYAQQQVAYNNAWQAVGSLLSAGIVIVAVHLRLPPTVVIVLAVAVVPAINILNTLHYFAIRCPRLRPRSADINKAASKSLMQMGGKFFLISALSTSALNADMLIVANSLGPAVAGNYAVVVKLFGTLSLFITMIGLVLWPANTEALINGDVSWVRKVTLRVSALSAAIALLAGLPLLLSTDRLLEVWIASSELSHIPRTVLVGLLLWSIALAAASPFFMVQNGAGVLGPQLLAWAFYLPAATLGKIFLVRSFGLVSVPAVGLILYVAVVLPFAGWGYTRALKKAGQEDLRKVTVPSAPKLCDE